MPRGCPAGGSRAARLNEAGEEGAPRSCCAGEAVGLDVELHNPLQLDLAVTHLRLACSWEPAAGAAGGGGSGPGGSPSAAQGAAGEQGFQVRCIAGAGHLADRCWCCPCATFCSGRNIVLLVCRA